MASNPTLREALRLHKAGWDVLPARGKRPLGKWGGRDRKPGDRLTEPQVRQAFDKSKPPDLVVILQAHQAVVDLDPQNDKSVMEKLAPALLAVTKCAETPSGGLHAHVLTNTETRTAHPIPGVDILGRGSVVAMPPSHGRKWAGVAGRHAIKDAGIWARGLIREAGYEPSEDRQGSEWLRAVEFPKAKRNIALASVGGELRKFGWTGENLYAILEGLNDLRCKPPLAGAELEEIMEMSKSLSQYRPDPAAFDGYTVHRYDPHAEAPPLEWLIGEGRAGILPAEGVTLLHGAGGQGKSYAAMAALLAVLTGTPMLTGGGGIPAQQGQVLYVDWERRGSIFQRRLRAMSRVVEDFYRVKVPLINYMDAQQPLHKLVDPIRAHLLTTQARLVVIDSLTISLQGADVKEAGEVIPAMFALNDLPAAVLVIDHQRKTQPGENAKSADAFGSVFKGNIASMIWQVSKDHREFDPDGMDFTLYHRKNNFDAAPEDVAIRLDFQYKADRLHRAELTRRVKELPADMIARLLQDAGEEALTRKRIAAQGIPVAVVQTELRRFIDQGLVRNVGGAGGRGNEGLYVWAGADLDSESEPTKT